MRIKLFQTADANVYYDMLIATSQTARAFCRRADVAYECFIGARRGWQPWHATYNRIPYVFDLLMEGYEGWVLYMDADAYVNDLDFDLRGYLADKGKYALIATRAGGSELHYDINIGVLLMNMGHPLMKELAREWYAYLCRYDLTTDTSGWSERLSDDQAMLQELLSVRPHSEAAVLYESWDFINSHYASFVRQIMRSTGMTLEERVAGLEARVAEVLGRGPAANAVAFQPVPFVETLFQSLLGRPADPGSLADFVARLRTGDETPGALVDACVRSREFADQLPRLLDRLSLRGQSGFLNDETRFGDLHLLLQRWLDHTAVAKFIVDVGARSRQRSDAYDLCRWFGWRALLVEANPALAPTIEAAFAGLDAQLVSCALSDYEGTGRLILSANDEVASFEREGSQACGETQGVVEVRVRRLPCLLAERGVPERFDLLSIDIEGHDIRVLDDLVQDGRFTPSWVLLEASPALTLTRLEETRCSEAVLRDYEMVGAGRANLLLRRRGPTEMDDA